MFRVVCFLFVLMTGSLVSGCGPRDERIEKNAVREAIRKSQRHCEQTSFAWLEELIRKAEQDQAEKGSASGFRGWISIVHFENQPLFYVNILMGTGSGLPYLRDCQGSVFEPAEGGLYPTLALGKEGDVIYTTRGFHF